MRKNKWLLATGMVMVLGLAACQKSPDSSIVVNKDLDNLIDQAQNSENGGVNVTDVAQNYDIYQTNLQDDSLGVIVNVDAKVDIPKTDQMSVFRVAQAPITQELLTKVQQELVSGTLYDGAALSVKTQGDIERELQFERDYYNSLAQEYEGEDLQIMQEEIQRSIDSYQEAYESAPKEVQWSEYPSDGQLHSAEERYQEDSDSEFYSWHYDLNPNGQVYYGVTDGTDGTYRSLYAQNNPERGNCIRYRRDKHGYEWVSGMEPSNLEAVNGGGISQDIWDAAGDIPQHIYDQYGGEVTFTEIQDEPVTISQEDAVGMADAFLTKLGIEDFQYYNGGLYNEVLDLRYRSDLDERTGAGYRKEYILSYMRNIDGAFVTFEAAGKHEEGWNGDSYVKKDWGIECIEFRINDAGIVGFDYYSPLTIVETVVDQSNMKTFEEVRSTFETMVAVTNAVNPDVQEGSVTIEIDRVILGYARISEADSYDTGLIVPVWDFKGKKTDTYGMETYGSVMTINAIDGSVIDRGLGY